MSLLALTLPGHLIFSMYAINFALSSVLYFNTEKITASPGTWSGRVCEHVCLHACFVWPLGLFMSIYYVVSSRYASAAVFGLPRLFLRLTFVLSLTCPSLCRLGLHSPVRWRSAWLSCTCGPPRAHSKSEVALITMFNLPPSLSIILSLSPFSLLPLTPSCSGSFCHHSLCFHTFSPPSLYLL